METDSPGIVLSRMKPTAPPTNMPVLSRTVIIWSATSDPVDSGTDVNQV